ncbi:hypothetical protein GCM10022198_00540 [Klugiella xanthotipulae]|uniref:Uncharacterized protein DUF955 n=1 Tax=Klugiella xanthotipulae TaxID=244735 RepID=A0A543I5E9_9MICO|nr:ImmA/IrrE family metallo-endopeptidase [Klugiella xanthotipulae]TQM65807.1 uncharacterized protein DUF955 [Klugiella xanthotipulae]
MHLYDPWEHAASLGITVVYYPLRTSKGMWVPERRMIFLRSQQRAFVERCVLAHELAHAENGDPTGHHPRYEARANRIAAERLINPRDLSELVRVYSDGDQICRELGVTRELFTAYWDEYGGCNNRHIA